jgi:hypothetical protein
MTTIDVHAVAGDFAEDKDVAKRLRIEQITPGLARGDEVRISFEGVSLATQSFLHALISEAIRKSNGEALDHLIFTGANKSIQNLISIVVEYSQEALADLASDENVLEGQEAAAS